MKNDIVPGTEFIILQNNNNFKYTSDSLILTSFSRPKGLCVDLGSGTGIIAFRNILKNKVKNFINFEINKETYELNNKSISINKLENKIKCFNTDINNIKNFIKINSVDTVIMNPPYFMNSLENINENLKIARHNYDIDLFIKNASYILKDRGKFYMIFPINNLVELFNKMIKYKIEPKRLKFIKKNINAKSNLVLIEAIKNGNSGLIIELDFLKYNLNNKMTEEFLKVYKNEEI